ncbi:extracellular matrix-binding protein EbhA-like [Eurosta solidaginis]|uniref:extracellular matrix-binding protein EbhA-like n=1 Tax=Eurosta solidaginis TaxID=178769 RepID=UPI0035305F1E
MKNYYLHMKYKYGEATCITLKHLSKQKQKLANLKCQLKFLLECKRYSITPTHLNNAIKNITINTTSNQVKKQLEKTKKLFLNKVLNIEITQTNIDIKISNNNIHHAENRLKRQLNNTDFSNFIEKQNFLSQRITKEREETHKSKLNRLKYQQICAIGIHINNDFFVNKTNIEFPDEVRWLLSLGRKFSIPTTKTNFTPINIIAEMEQVIQNIKDDKAKDVARNKLSNRVLQFKRNARHNEKEKFILHAFNKAKTFLNQHKNIVITDADKGNKTVALYKDDYMTKMKTILDDKSTYKTMRSDPTNELQKKNNKIIEELHKNKQINSKEKQLLACSTAIAPRIYGLPKIHKRDIPLRPIVSSINAPCYNMSSFAPEEAKVLSETLGRNSGVLLALKATLWSRKAYHNTKIFTIIY